MKETKIYQFIGKPSHDFIIYLSSILQNLTKSILLFDETNYIRNYIPISDSKPQPIHYRGVDYFYNFHAIEWVDNNTCVSITSKENLVNLEKYDFIFILSSLNQYNRRIEKSQTSNEISQLIFRTINQNDSLDAINDTCKVKNRSIATIQKESNLLSNISHYYLFTNPVKNNIESSSKFINLINRPTTIILRDFCEGKFNFHFYMDNYFNEHQNIEKKYQIPLDEIDYEYRIRLGYEAFKEFKNISKDYESVLLQIAKEISKAQDHEIRKAYQRARKGEVYESSVF